MSTPVAETRVASLRLAHLFGALSHALDLVEGQPAGHSVRCAWISVQIGRHIGLTDAEISDLFYTVLLKDLGCSSNAARICQLYLTDDRTFKRDVKTLNTASLTQAIRFILSHTGLKSGLAERFRALLHVGVNSNEIAREVIETRCHQGADIARRMRFSEAVAEGILSLDEHWNGGGHPEGKAGDSIPIFSRLALLSQVIDVFYTSGGKDTAIRETVFRSGTWFDPELVQQFLSLARDDRFWTRLGSPDIASEVYDLEPAQRAVVVDDDYLDDVALGFSHVIDAKSPYTGGHSERVSLFTDMIAAELRYSLEHRRWLKRAALLHDIGKLGISNLILDKAGPLDQSEWADVRQHPLYSEDILRHVPWFQSIADIVGGHHERLDGRGYPRGLSAADIPMDTRIIATADIFDALTADRPYRPAMPVETAIATISDMVGTHVDADCFDALKRGLATLDEMPTHADAAA